MNEDSKTEVEEDVAAEVATAVDDSSAAETSAKAAVKWFEIVEVDAVGFKAFCRLPNDFQHRDIREKALAAKARRIRQLRHSDSDANVVLESELEQIVEHEAAEEILLTELMTERFFRDREEAIIDVIERDEFEHIKADQQRWSTLRQLDPDERPGDEYRELTEHLAAFNDAVDERIKEIQQPVRQALKGLGIDGMIDKVRANRIDSDAGRVFNETYLFWQVYVGTLAIPEDFDLDGITQKNIPCKRVFATEVDLREADPAVVSRLQDTFTSLEGALASLTSGNS